MKQHITYEQLEELSQPARAKLRDYILGGWKADFEFKGEQYTTEMPAEYYVLSIGQMIEFLDERGLINLQKLSSWHGGGYSLLYGIQPKKLTEKAIEESMHRYDGELTDILWSAVKEILEK